MKNLVVVKALFVVSGKFEGIKQLILTSLAVEGPSLDSAILDITNAYCIKIAEKIMILELKCQRLDVDQKGSLNALSDRYRRVIDWKPPASGGSYWTTGSK